ncbi:MAG: sigma-70 family RNA polymerase sigma factor, partial [Cyanobacteria bacterium]|nr:sigma-70 family RNA polymerase sigma factor [Cyanobacteriota bacterium]
MPRLSDKKNTVAIDFRDNDAVGALLHSAGRLPLLTADQEIKYARQIQQAIACIVAAINEHECLMARFGELLDEKNPTQALTRNGFSRSLVEGVKPYLSPEGIRAVEIGTRAREKMTSHNIRLVVSIVKKFLTRQQFNGQATIAQEDMIQEGCVGLLRAAEKFEPERGYKFSTYAYWWITQGITRLLNDQSRTIRLPIHVCENFSKLRRLQAKAMRNGQERIAPADLALQLYPKAKSPEDAIAKMRKLIEINQFIASLDLPVGDGDMALGDMIADPTTDLDPATQLERIFLMDRVQTAISDLGLTSREQYLLDNRLLAAGSGSRMTLQEVGKNLPPLYDGANAGCSRERVRQLERGLKVKLSRRLNPLKELI